MDILRKIQKELPTSHVIPQAVFFEGWLHVHNQEYDKARPIFESLISNYPRSSFAEKAGKLLSGFPTATP